ncbi:putative clathrin assembly protein At5g35200 isoform X2 [Mercurialis annua]|uniref:putative clathrin assembly protein At5g35200 isoform X2 n=1 Tax=Mercurialis annua TaxID=3986 RepID=UPI00215EDA91|nr:putative clathrin assembly protein At5g35200 isoform X2 [Mercurialis annua]
MESPCYHEDPFTVTKHIKLLKRFFKLQRWLLLLLFVAILRRFLRSSSGRQLFVCKYILYLCLIRMAAGGSTQQTLRRAFGALKDSTTVGLAKVNSENKGLDVAIVKATNHDEVLPKEKHVTTIFSSLCATKTRAEVVYCINGLTKRLAKTQNWTVALKTLVVIHRAVRELDATFHEELVNYRRGARLMFNLSHFRDDSSPSAWDCSAWVRTYALYLEERLECFRLLKYDIQKNHSRSMELDNPALLEQLPAMQQLLFRLLACKPEGLAVHNSLVHYALSIVAGESVRLYIAITDGVLNLVDEYFEMERHDAVRALEIYKKAASQGETLSEFFEMCSSLDFGRRQKYVKIQQPPASFLTSMEEYVAEAPHVLALEWIQINDDEHGTPRAVLAPQAVLLIEQKQEDDLEKSDQCADESHSNQNEAAATTLVADLLGFDDLTQEASESDEKSYIGISVVPSGNSVNSETSNDSASQATSWELALVSAPSSNGNAVSASKMAGGLDKLTLDSLYDNAAMVTGTNQNGAYQMGQIAPNPFETGEYNVNTFQALSNITPTTTNFQKVPMSQEQGLLIIQHQQTNMVGFDLNNPFGNPFVDQNIPNSIVGENVPLHLPQNANSSLI